MAHITQNRVLESTTTTGTGALTLAGAVTGFRTFASVMAAADTCFYEIWEVDANGLATGNYEAGLGTFNTTLTRTTVLDSSNAGSAVNFAAGTKLVAIAALASRTVQFNNELAQVLPIVPANPAAAATDTLKFYARKIGGRIMPKWMPPSGLDSFVQPALFGNNVVLYMPNTGTTAGLNLGTPWVVGTTISHPTPASTAPAMFNQLKRTRSANVATTTNQVLGVNSIATGAAQFWRGNAAGLGGFFFYARFTIELWPAATVRLFVGLQSGTTALVASDTLPAVSACGLWHATTDAATVLNFMTKDGTTATNTAITLNAALAANQVFDFYMFMKPNDSTIYYRLDDIVVGNTLVDTSTTATLPATTTFMGPAVNMSNGTANVTVTTTAIGVAKIYIESDH